MVAHAWTVRRRAPDDLLSSLSVGSPLLAQLLLNREVDSPAAAAAFLDVADPAADPFAMADMPAAVDRITRAVRDRERIVVHGDYDVDGLSGATLLALALEAVGAQVDVFIPHRERDGYGINSATVQRLADSGASLLLSVDCGIGAADQVATAARLGLDVVITDHHQVPELLPAAVAVLNPLRTDCAYPFKWLAGAGVALRFAEAILDAFDARSDIADLRERLYELAALGTVADVMPLLGENRAIVRRGLRRLATRPCPGLAALCRRSRIEPGEVLASSIAFRLAPRLNAAGRLDDAIAAQRLLSSRGDDEAEGYADQLEALNLARRALTDDALTRAREQLSAQPNLADGAVVVAGDFPLGILGLVAARLADEHGRPAVAIRTSDEPCRGSARSVPGFDVAAAVGRCADLLISHGGHAGAAGLSLAGETVSAFRGRFQQAALDLLPHSAPKPLPEADCQLSPSRLRPDLLELLARLEPCGQANREPLFESRGLQVRAARPIAERHLRLTLSASGPPVVAVAFNAAADAPSPGERIDALYHVRRNSYRGSFAIELELRGWRFASS